jgi:hypothetical protein
MQDDTLFVGLDLVDAGDDPSDGRQRRNQRQSFATQARKMRQAGQLLMDQAGDLLEILVLVGGSPSSVRQIHGHPVVPIFAIAMARPRPVARDKLKFVPDQLYASGHGRRRRGNACGNQRMTTTTTSPKTTALLRQPSIPAARYGWS